MESFEEVHGRWRDEWCFWFVSLLSSGVCLLSHSSGHSSRNSPLLLHPACTGQSKVVGTLTSTDINRLCSPSLLVTDPRSRYTADGFGKLLAGSPTRRSSGVSYPVVATTPTTASIHPPITRRVCVSVCRPQDEDRRASLVACLRPPLPPPPLIHVYTHRPMLLLPWSSQKGPPPNLDTAPATLGPAVGSVWVG